MAGITPHEFLNLSQLEQDLLVQSASELEEWRFKQLGKLLGA